MGRERGATDSGSDSHGSGTPLVCRGKWSPTSSIIANIYIYITVYIEEDRCPLNDPSPLHTV